MSAHKPEIRPMILDEEISFWKTATESASSKELALVAFGFQWGLKMARDKLLACGAHSATE
jgi:hypothetical protein